MNDAYNPAVVNPPLPPADADPEQKASHAAKLRAAGLSTNEIADAMGVNPRTIPKWFNKFPAVIIQPGMIENVPETLNETIEYLERSAAFETAAIKANIDAGKMGNGPALWRITKVLTQLVILRVAVPSDTGPDYDAQSADDFRSEMAARLNRMLAAEENEKNGQALIGDIGGASLDPSDGCDAGNHSASGVAGNPSISVDRADEMTERIPDSEGTGSMRAKGYTWLNGFWCR